MAIRDTFRRALRRSDSSATSQNDSSSSNSNSTAPSTAGSEQPSLHKTQSRLGSWTWASNNKHKEPRERKNKDKSRNQRQRTVIHPSQRPVTAQNLAHQEMLSHFTMTFGTSRPEQIETESFIGISPCCTRTPSLAGDSDDDYTPNSSGSATPQLSDR